MGVLTRWQRGLAGSWLLLVLLLILTAWRQGAVFDSSIMALLPQSQQQPQVQKASDQLAASASRQLLVLISADTAGQSRQAAEQLAAQLQSLASIRAIRWQFDVAALQRLQQQAFDWRLVRLPEALRQQLLAEQYQPLEQRAMSQLLSPVGGLSNLLDDPFGLALNAENSALANGIEPRDGMLWLAAEPNPGWLLMVELAADAFDLAVQHEVMGTLHQFEQRHADQGIHLTLSGLIMHAAAGADQARREMSTIGIGSLVGIIVLMLLVFRRPGPLLMLFLPMTIGCLVAVATTLVLFERLHLITLAFGAGLVGVSIDYALHYLCERHHLGDRSILPRLLPGLVLGLASSVVAYGALGLAPFPGLRQMACFAVAGLVASWLTVVLWFPFWRSHRQPAPLPAADQLYRLRQRLPSADGRRAVGLWGVVVLAGLALLAGRSSDDIRQLQTSPAELLVQEQRIQQALGQRGSSRFLLLEADNLEALLQREEQLRDSLDALVVAGQLSGYQALSQSLPSLRRQQQNLQLLTPLYNQRLAALFQQLGLPAVLATQAQQRFEQQMDARLEYAHWQMLDSSAPWQALLIENSPRRAISLIRLQALASTTTEQQLRQLADAEQGLWYVDRIRDLSGVLQSYRQQVTGWLLLAGLLVLLGLGLRYRRRALQVVRPVLSAALITLALMMHLDGGINLFHLMALMLVIGIGLDMGIFLMETGFSRHTWLAVSLSMLTSLLAFGLLALSRTPVLHHFGITVLTGLMLVWLITAISSPEAKEKESSSDVKRTGVL